MFVYIYCQYTESVIIWATSDPYAHVVPTYGNASLMIIISAVAVFELFRRLQIRSSKIINFLGGSTLMIFDRPPCATVEGRS